MPPKETTEDKFERIADEVSGDAAAVKCDVEEYHRGLNLIIDRLKTDLEAAGGKLSEFGGGFDDE